MPEINRQIMLREIPRDKLSVEHFALNEEPAPSPNDGQVLLRPRYVSLDAASRATMMGATYRAALTSGVVMSGLSLAEVITSKSPNLKAGDFVITDTGWQDYAVRDGANLQPIRGRAPGPDLLNVYGIPGLTAYFGLLNVGAIKTGETVVVSAAGGAVGSLVAQIAKLYGCRVVGVAGGAEKCEMLQRELGFDAVVDHQSGDVRKSLQQACPKGIDVYFDNVGGDILEACLFNMALHGRIVCCGAVSQYDGAKPTHGPRGVPGLLVTKRLTMSGFLVFDFNDQKEAALKQLEDWVQSGALKPRTEVIDGLEQLPAALVGVLAGKNIGKRVVKV